MQNIIARRGVGACLLALWAFAPALAQQPAPRNWLSGTADLGGHGCSGAVVRLSNNEDAPAVLLSNGHCIRTLRDKDKTGVFFANLPMQKPVFFYDRTGQGFELNTTRLLYATMTGTDVLLMELEASPRDFLAQGIDVYEISPKPAQPGEAIVMPSGAFKTIQQCSIDKIVYRLKGWIWEWNDAYSLGTCGGDVGTSGSPLISTASGKIVGVKNSYNSGGSCADGDTCEVDRNGHETAVKGKHYGQRVDQILTCVTPDGKFDLSLPSCALFHGN